MKYLKAKKHLLVSCLLSTMIFSSLGINVETNSINIGSPVNIVQAASRDKYGVTIGGTATDSITTIKLTKNESARKGTSLATVSVRKISKNSTIKVTHVTTGWARVQFIDGQTGWVPLSSGKLHVKKATCNKIIKQYWSKRKVTTKKQTFSTGIKFINEANYKEAILQFDGSNIKIDVKK